jgi:hypothetical protein
MKTPTVKPVTLLVGNVVDLHTVRGNKFIGRYKADARAEDLTFAIVILFD